MSQEMTDLQAAVAAEDSVIGGFIVWSQGVSAQIADAAGDKAASTALAADVKTQTQAMADALAANTPVTPAQLKAKKGK